MPERILPVLVGTGQTIDRPADPAAGREPLVLMEEAARRAAEDAGGGARLLAAPDTVAVVNVVRHDYGDAAGLLAERLGCQPARTIYTTLGGNTPQSLVNHLCDEIAAGRTELALVAGAEAWHTARALGRAGRPSGWAHRPVSAPPWGDGRPGVSTHEARHGIGQPIVTYPMVENAFRAARRLSLEAHRRELAAFAARAAAIAAENPYAWFRDAKDAATLATVTAENRMVGFPYPKFMNAILDVNQGGGAAARERGRRAAPGARTRTLGLPVGGRRRHRALVLPGPRGLPHPARPPTRRRAPPRGGRPRHRARAAPRPLQLLPDRAAPLGRDAGPRPRRPAPAHRDRRPPVVRRPGQQLHDACGRDARGAAPRRAGEFRARARARLESDQARARDLRGDAAAEGLAARGRRVAPAVGRRAPAPARGGGGLGPRHDRGLYHRPRPRRRRGARRGHRPAGRRAAFPRRAAGGSRGARGDGARGAGGPRRPRQLGRRREPLRAGVRDIR